MLTSLFKALAHLWTSAADLLTDERHHSVRVSVILGTGFVLLVLIGAGFVAGRIVPAEHPLWEAVLLFRLVLLRLVLAGPIALVGALVGVTLYQVFENSDLGSRLVVPLGSDDAHSEAQKVGNGGRLLTALVGACILGFLFGVLR